LAWSPARWLTFDAAADAFLLLAGVATFGAFQTGVELGPRVTVREGAGFETRARYQHTFKLSLDPNYDYLAGNRDDVVVTQGWPGRWLSLKLGYQYRIEAIGIAAIALNQIYFSGFAGGQPVDGMGRNLFSADAAYVIPFSYTSHQATAN